MNPLVVGPAPEGVHRSVCRQLVSEGGPHRRHDLVLCGRDVGDDLAGVGAAVSDSVDAFEAISGGIAPGKHPDPF